MTKLKNKPAFIITIDTEGDNIWDNPSVITTENANYLSRFQDICNKYNFKPVYLTNYEMAISENFRKFAEKQIRSNNAEIGMHLHAWNSPPFYEPIESKKKSLPYLIEYPNEIIRKKIEYITKLLEDTFGIKMFSHRAGRWAFNEFYAEVLTEYGYITDCSVTPYVSWENHSGAFEGGSDYTDFPDEAYFLNLNDISEKGESDLLEVPMTIIKKDNFISENFRNIKNRLLNKKRKIKTSWLRPNGKNLNEMLKTVEVKLKNKCFYIEFMLHSSEFMPGGSPNFKTKEDIEKLYSDLEILFNRISKNFIGMDLKTFYGKYKEEAK